MEKEESVAETAATWLTSLSFERWCVFMPLVFDCVLRKNSERGENHLLAR